MKKQKEMTKFCPKCNKNTIQSVAIYKKCKDRKTAEVSRRHSDYKKGYCGQKFPDLKRTAKTTQKINLRYTCKNCQRKTMKEGMRMRNLEIQPLLVMCDEKRKYLNTKTKKQLFICTVHQLPGKTSYFFPCNH